MKIFTADYIITADEHKTIIQNGAIAFTNTIIQVGTKEQIQALYPQATLTALPPKSIIMPTLANPHIHFEFSKNKSSLRYGSFLGWLYSVIAKREELIESLKPEDIAILLEDLFNVGITTIGAVSSYGFDLVALSQAPQNVVFFPEVLGSRPDMIDALYQDFLNRYGEAKKYESTNFQVGIAIHAPYSTHPILIKKVLQLAKNDQAVVQAHFMESPEEKEWLENSSGGFSEFFQSFLNQKTALTSAEEFLSHFGDIEHLSFTHCTQANQTHLQHIQDLGATILHCPVSNRLLSNTKLSLKIANKIALATDGLSSNISLNLWDELKNALMIHTQETLNELSTSLLYYATAGSAGALGRNCGVLASNFDADFLVLSLDDDVLQEDLCTQVILQTTKPDQIILGGEVVRKN